MDSPPHGSLTIANWTQRVVYPCVALLGVGLGIGVYILVGGPDVSNLGLIIPGWLAAIGTIALSWAATFYVYRVVRRRQVVERLVELRSGELAAANSELKAREGRVRAIVDTVLDGILTIDAQGIIETFNPAAELIFGYDASEVIGRNIKMLMPEPYYGGHDGYLDAYLVSGDPKVIGIGREVVGRRRNGTEFPMELAVSEMEVMGERMFTGIVRDITERKEAERQLRDREGRVRAIVETVLDGIITIDAHGTVETFNPAAELIFGYGADEVIGRNIKMLMPDPYHSGHDGYLGAYLVSGDPKVIGIGREVVGRRRDGTEFPMELAVSEMEVVGQRMFTGIVRDITERKEAERQLRDREGRVRAIVDTVLDGIITIDARGTVETFNPAAELIFGYDSSEVIGRNVKMLMPDPYHGGHDGYLGNYLNSGEAKVIGIGREVIGRRRDGSEFPMELAVSEMEVAGQRMFTGIVRDITERKEAERIKKEFISTISHELRTPLTSIWGSLGLISGGACGEIAEDAAQMLEMAEQNTGRLIGLVNDILDIERLESGGLRFETNRISLSDLVADAINVNQPYAELQNAKIAPLEISASAFVMGDEVRLSQVMANLISNAVKFSPDDGTVYVSLTRRDDGYKVRVIDHGPGIPAEFQAKVFERFSQADSSDSREKGGSGLGLSISAAIIENHDGKIGFESEPGNGACFYFDLPAVAEDAPVTAVSSGSELAETFSLVQ